MPARYCPEQPTVRVSRLADLPIGWHRDLESNIVALPPPKDAGGFVEDDLTVPVAPPLSHAVTQVDPALAADRSQPRLAARVTRPLTPEDPAAPTVEEPTEREAPASDDDLVFTPESLAPLGAAPEGDTLRDPAPVRSRCPEQVLEVPQPELEAPRRSLHALWMLMLCLLSLAAQDPVLEQQTFLLDGSQTRLDGDAVPR